MSLKNDGKSDVDVGDSLRFPLVAASSPTAISNINMQKERISIEKDKEGKF